MTIGIAPMLELRGVTLSAGGRTLVHDLSFAMKAGDLCAVLGKNGAGKSTLLAAAAGLRPVQLGSVALQGRPIGRWPGAQAARMRGFLPQSVHDSFSCTALDVVLLGRHPHVGRWHWENEDDRRAAMQALAAFDLAELAHRDVLTLSGGERQRVALAQLLAQDPGLLLLDEPTSHLDMHHQVSLMRTLATLAGSNDKAILFATHDLNLAARHANCAVVLMGDGTVTFGPVREVMSEAALSRAFAHPLERVAAGESFVYLPRW